MTESWWADEPTHIVVHEVFNHLAGMPVRAIQTLLTRGEDPIEYLRIGLSVNLRGGVPELSHWAVVAAGVLGDPRPLPELLAHLPLAAQRRSVGLGFATAEAVAKLGNAAEQELVVAAAAVPVPERYWHCYAAALGTGPESLEFLVRELEVSPALRDIAALGLAHRGCEELPMLLRVVMKRVHPWQRGRVQWALKALLHGVDAFGRCTPDWRLRYRYHPGWIDFPGIVPCVAAVVRAEGEYRDFVGSAAPHRTIEEVHALPLPPTPDTSCVLCGLPGCNITGVWSCPACAPAVAEIQSDFLLEVGRPHQPDDILDALDLVELGHLRVSSQYASAAAAPGQLEERHRTLLALGGCRWLVEEGVEGTCEGAAALLAAGEERRDTGRPLPPGPADHAAWC